MVSIRKIHSSQLHDADRNYYHKSERSFQADTANRLSSTDENCPSGSPQFQEQHTIYFSPNYNLLSQ